MRSLSERFEAKVSPEPMSGCWLWTASISNSGDNFGYGQIWSGKNKPELAHRAAWRIYRGEIPAGLKVLHKCDNPGCVNPDHLFIGTQADNMADCRAKGRTHLGSSRPSMAGEKHHGARLTWAAVDEIRALYRAGTLSLSKLGERFGISKRSILFITSGRHWPEASRPAVAAPST